MKKSTILNVAAKAGVSKSTVSAVISGSADALGICEATRKKVQCAIDSLGYRPDATARAMRLKRHNSIGLILSTRPGESFFTEMCHVGIQKVLSAANMH
ncbi:MAG: LacI family DNA-binding transcriptional regulator, partial [Candidatus Lindowbacteria bacterium]|nr:LacI family DNA-binding transcriptional regulator [Candidatus Lindowbacteria bacterium]